MTYVAPSIFNGTALADVISGTARRDVVSTFGGSDNIFCGNGNDVVFGGSGNDFLYGDAGNDILRGGSGADYFEGGLGNDLLWGGSGSDRFTFFSDRPGLDTILDWSFADVIFIEAVDSFSKLTIRNAAVGGTPGGVEITWGTDDKISIDGDLLRAGNFSAADFDF